MNKENFRKLIEKNKNKLNDDNQREKAINGIQNDLQDACDYKITVPSNDEYFKFACFVGSWRKYAYYMGNANHLLVIEKKDTKNFDDIKQLCYEEVKAYNHEILELSNGYVKNKSSLKFTDVEYSTDTDIYKYVEMAGWLEEEDYNNALLLRRDEYDRIEIHHIDGDSSNNRVDNLIYIPNKIHCFIHSKKKVSS